MTDVYQFTEEEYTKLGDAIVWTAILAAIHQDGVIEPDEKAVAIKQAHIRTFSTEEYIKPIYQHLDDHFERDFDAFSSTLPQGQEQMEEYIQKKMAESLEILPKIGPWFAKQFSEDLREFYNRVFRANSNVFQFFAFPVISAHLEKFGLK